MFINAQWLLIKLSAFLVHSFAVSGLHHQDYNAFCGSLGQPLVQHVDVQYVMVINVFVAEDVMGIPVALYT